MTAAAANGWMAATPTGPNYWRALSDPLFDI